MRGHERFEVSEATRGELPELLTNHILDGLEGELFNSGASDDTDIYLESVTGCESDADISLD